MYKQVGYRFYRPGALSIAQTLADLPINMTKVRRALARADRGGKLTRRL